MDKWAVVELVKKGWLRRKIRNQVQVSGYVSGISGLYGPGNKSDQYNDQAIGVSTFWDSDYPLLLKEIADAPVALFWRGRVDNNKPLIAVVGSRNISQRGRKALTEFVPAIVAAGYGIVSGLAYGTDALAHQTCLACGGYTLAVLPTDLDHIYPKENLALAEQIIMSGGGLVSEYPWGSITRRKNFLERNRVVSGLCLGTLVVEAAARSGSISTPNFAIDQGREVWCVAAKQGEPNSEGILALIEDGAYEVTAPEEMILGLKEGASTCY